MSRVVLNQLTLGLYAVDAVRVGCLGTGVFPG